jgi:hypothetical protein
LVIEMMRVLLDSMIFDAIVADAQFKADVLNVISAGDLLIVSTHVQEDQLSKIPDQAKRGGDRVDPAHGASDRSGGLG